MYSRPIVRAYESRRIPRISRSFMNRFSLLNEPVANSRSRSHRVRPCDAVSRSGWLRGELSSGLVSAMRWPRTRKAWISSSTRDCLCTSSSWLTAMSWAQRIGS